MDCQAAEQRDHWTDKNFQIFFNNCPHNTSLSSALTQTSINLNSEKIINVISWEHDPYLRTYCVTGAAAAFMHFYKPAWYYASGITLTILNLCRNCI